MPLTSGSPPDKEGGALATGPIGRRRWLADRLKGGGARVDGWSVGSNQTVLLQCLDAAGRAAGADAGWVSARTVARLLSPTADPEAVGRELSRLGRLGLVELWFKGGHSYYRLAP